MDREKKNEPVSKSNNKKKPGLVRPGFFEKMLDRPGPISDQATTA